MPPLSYHEGQRAVQNEANTVEVADRLADWVGPAAAFAEDADLIIMASRTADSRLEFTVVSGSPPLAKVIDDAPITIEFSPRLSARLPLGNCGGLVIGMSTARRARVNGLLSLIDGKPTLRATEAFTLCRKYIAPSISPNTALRVGPSARRRIALDEPYLQAVLERAETCFLATICPKGNPDVSHRGGPPGFIEFDAKSSTLSWPEFVGDGVFKSAGNLRATRSFTLLVADFETGDAVELSGVGNYTNTRPERRPRTDALVRHKEQYPAQGYITAEIQIASRLDNAFAPRERIEKAIRITSRSDVDEQAPR